MTTKLQDLFPEINNNNEQQGRSNLNPKLDYSPNQNVSSILNNLNNSHNNQESNQMEKPVINDDSNSKEKSNNENLKISKNKFILDGLFLVILSIILDSDYFIKILQSLLFRIPNFYKFQWLFSTIKGIILAILYYFGKEYLIPKN